MSSGIEPIFALDYTRKVLQPDGTKRTEKVVDYAVALFRHRFGDTAKLPDHIVTAESLTPREHLKVQAAVQKYIDSSISKTINCPEDLNFDDFKSVYTDAYAMGLKGCTTYRPNDVRGSVLSADPEPMTGENAQSALPLEAPRAHTGN